MLNASPAPEEWDTLPETLRAATRILVVNAVEAARLTGHATLAPGRAAEALSARTGVATVIVTLGGAGNEAVDEGTVVRQVAFPASVVDTVGAGDAFLGTVVVALLEGVPMAEALRRGAAAGAMAVSRHGVHDALPTRGDVDLYLTATGGL